MNIMYKGGTKVVFEARHLLFNEPPKIFEFTKFDVTQIISSMPFHDTTHPLGKDDAQHSISEKSENAPPKPLFNSLGYLIDPQGNIVDKRGRLVFRLEILEPAVDDSGRVTATQVEIPFVFRDRNVEVARKNTEAIK
jgi:hypothetical protein